MFADSAISPDIASRWTFTFITKFTKGIPAFLPLVFQLTGVDHGEDFYWQNMFRLIQIDFAVFYADDLDVVFYQKPCDIIFEVALRQWSHEPGIVIQQEILDPVQARKGFSQTAPVLKLVYTG